MRCGIIGWAIALLATWSIVVADSTFAASAPVRVASYGANGTHWPSLLPTPFLYDDTVPNIINVTCTWRAISNAIISVTPAQASAGVLIRVAPGTLTGNGAGAGNAAVLKNIGSSSWSQRVTVCPRDGYGTVIFSGGVRLINVRGVCFAGLSGDSIKLEGCDSSALAWAKVTAWLAGYGLAGQATANVEYCEVVIPDSRVVDGDASDFYAVSGGPLTNWLFDACYIAPRFFNPATTPKPHTDSLQFAGTCSSMCMRDVAIFASNNCSVQTGSILDLILDHSYVVSGAVARSRYPFLDGGSTENGATAFNGNGTGFSATNSVFIGGMCSATWTYVTNTRTSYAYAASQQPATGSWTVDTSLSATNPPMPPYPTDTYLGSIWSNHVTGSLLALTPASLDFGTVFCGLNSSASFVVSNAGIGLLSGTATIPGGPFTLKMGNGVGLAIPGLGWTNLVVQFTPPAAGVFSNVIVFATDGGSTTNSLYGVGADLPVLLMAAQDGASVVFQFPTVSGKNYTLEYRDGLDDQAWLPLQGLVGDGGTNSFTNSTGTRSQRFYRLSAR